MKNAINTNKPSYFIFKNMHYLNKNRITSIVLPFLSFHPTKTTPNKWIAATLLVSSTLFFVTHLYKLMIEDQKQITQTIHQPKHLLSLDSKTSVLIVLALLLKALYALIQAYLQRKNKIPALRLPNQKSFLASNTLYGGIQR